MNGRKSRAISRAARTLGAKPNRHALFNQRDKRNRIIPDAELRLVPGSFKAVRKMLKREGVLLTAREAGVSA